MKLPGCRHSRHIETSLEPQEQVTLENTTPRPSRQATFTARPTYSRVRAGEKSCRSWLEVEGKESLLWSKQKMYLLKEKRKRAEGNDAWPANHMQWDAAESWASEVMYVPSASPESPRRRTTSRFCCPLCLRKPTRSSLQRRQYFRLPSAALLY